jgi:hypothetical protein
MILGILASAGGGAAAGAYESIATANPTSGTTVTFSSIPSTYKHLQIRFNAIPSTAGGTLKMQFNGDTTSANYAAHWLNGDGSSVYAYGQSGYGSIPIIAAGNTVITYSNVGIVDILDYASTSKYKTVRSIAGYDNNSVGDVEVDSGLWLSTSAISSLVITLSPYLSRAFASGSAFALYGIKEAA